MKRIICIVLLLCLLFSTAACVKSPKRFTQVDKGVSDGDNTYQRIPDDWRFVGDINIPAGKSEAGKTVYSDKTGMFVKEKDPAFSMRKPTYAREDFAFPDIWGEEGIVVLSGTGKRLNKAELPTAIKHELVSLYEEMNDRSEKIDIWHSGFERTAVVSIEYIAVNLIFDPGLEIWIKGERLLMYHSSGCFCEISNNSELYSFVMENAGNLLM